MVTSEAPGPSEYTSRPDPAFVHPRAWEAVQKPPLLPAHKLPTKSFSSRAASLRIQRGRETKLAAAAACLPLADREGSAASGPEGAVSSGESSSPKNTEADLLGGNSSARSGEEGRAGAEEVWTENAGAGSVVAVGNNNNNNTGSVVAGTSSAVVHPVSSEEEDEEDDNGWSGDEGSDESSEAGEAGRENASVAADGGMAVDMGSQTWTLQELEVLWLQYDNNNSGQISFAEIEKVVVEQYPEFDNKEASTQRCVRSRHWYGCLRGYSRGVARLFAVGR